MSSPQPHPLALSYKLRCLTYRCLLKLTLLSPLIVKPNKLWGKFCQSSCYQRFDLTQITSTSKLISNIPNRITLYVEDFKSQRVNLKYGSRTSMSTLKTKSCIKPIVFYIHKFCVVKLCYSKSELEQIKIYKSYKS